ncbi:MAG: hypothetical protein D6702_00680 [Planctomycetota bacterium]|nr:MAG: hypothetical protein D6702_00680 [Planctomycetota bacterium]
MTDPGQNLLLRAFRFLGSVQMAMILIVACAIAMIAGTLIESDLGREMAALRVYHTPWFWGLQIMIAVNLAVAVINRLPLKRHQYSFAVVHLGFILMLAGGLITSMFGYEGRLYVTEGQSSNELVLNSRELIVRGTEAQAAMDVPTGAALAGTRLMEATQGFPSVDVLEYVPLGRTVQSLEAGAAGDPPGLAYSILPAHGPDDDHGHAPEVTGWLLAGDPAAAVRDHNVIEIGIEAFADAEAFADRTAAAPVAADGEFAVVIERGLGFPPVRIPLPEGLGRTTDLGGGLVARVESFARHAMVGSGGIVDSPDGRWNPAAVVVLTRDGVEERHTVFSLHPDFKVVKGGGDTPFADAVRLEAPAGAGLRPALRFLVDPTGELYVQEEGPSGRNAARPIAAGGRVAIPGYDYALVVDAYHPHARAGLRAIRLPANGNEGSPLLRVRLTDEAGSAETWVQLGRETPLALGGRSWLLKYAYKTRPLPFRVALDDFRVEFHPGSRRESEYASTVKVSPLADGPEPVDTVISMNRTLDYMGFRLFQSSYILGRNGGPDTTILSVNHDPGADVVYLAFAVLILGLCWYVTGDGRKKRAAAAAPAAVTSAAEPAPQPAAPPQIETVSS